MSQSTPLVYYDNLCIDLKQDGRTQRLVHNISFDIQRGEILGLVGESGSGKSITALSLLQLLPSPPMSVPNGHIVFNDLDVLTATDKQLRALRGGDIGCIFQEPMTSLNPLQTIEKQLAEALFLHQGLSREQSRPILLEWLTKVELKQPDKKLTAYPHQLSGGERQRVMIAMALLNRPKLLIADEPTTALDVTVQAQILELIQKLQKDLGMSVLFISHDLGIVERIANRIAVMQNGRLVETGDTASIFSSPQHEYTKKLLNAEPSGQPARTDNQDSPILTGKQTRVWFPIQRGVLRRTVGHVKAVDGIDFTLHKGQTLGIVGESGSGKSTLAKAILGLEKATGTINFDGQSLLELNAREWKPFRTRMQVVFQDPYGSLSPRMTVEQIIAEGLDVNRIGDKDSREAAVVDMMREVGLDPDSRHRYPYEFSGGQRQRIAIARAMILQPDVVILDEPTSSLDRTVQFQIIDLLKRFQQEKGMSYIFISHDLKVVRALAHHVLVMKDGQLIESGDHIFEAPQQPYTQALVNTAFHYQTRTG